MTSELKTRILNRTTDRDIFIHYMGLMGYPGYKPPKTVRSPFRKDRSPSFGVYKSNGTGEIKYFFKDFAGEQGDVFKFVTMYYEIYCGKKFKFYEILVNIANEMGVSVGKGLHTKVYKASPIVILPEVRKVFEEMQEYTMKLEYVTSPGVKYPTEAQHAYFRQYGVELDKNGFDNNMFFADCQVNILDKQTGAKISDKMFINTPDNPVFSFEAESFEDGSKAFRIYQPLKDKKDNKHYGNVHSAHIYNPEKGPLLREQLKAKFGHEPEFDKILVLLGGYKDAYLFNQLTPFHCCATGGESWGLHESFIKWIRDCKFKPVLMYDNDTAGKNAMDKIYKKWRIPWFTIEEFIDFDWEQKDFSDWAADIRNSMNIELTNLTRVVKEYAYSEPETW